MREPMFWWRPPGFAAALLSPVAAVYGAVAARRMTRSGRRAGLPVICVGNYTLGGSGKTPTVIAIARSLIAAGRKPVLLSRGYGGSIAGPLLVDAQTHNAAQVGDEPLLLAQVAPTVVSRDRIAGAELAQTIGADVIVMDDGLQNPSLAKTLRIAVIDGRRGLGNGKVFPAGPLRAPLAAQLAQTDAVLVVGDISSASGAIARVSARGLPIFHSQLEPDRAAIEALGGRKVLAFAGIGDPQKFFTTLAAAGIDAPARRSFPDHHRYSADDAGNLIMSAEHEGLRLLTTEKDRARIAGDPGLAALAQRAHALPVALKVNQESAWRELLLNTGR